MQHCLWRLRANAPARKNPVDGTSPPSDAEPADVLIHGSNGREEPVSVELYHDTFV